MALVIIDHSNKTDIFPPGVIFSSTNGFTIPENMDGITSHKLVSKEEIYKLLNVTTNTTNLPNLVIYPKIYRSNQAELQWINNICPTIFIGEELCIVENAPIPLKIMHVLRKSTLIDNCLYDGPYIKHNDQEIVVTEQIMPNGWKDRTRKIDGVLYNSKLSWPPQYGKGTIQEIVKKLISDYVLQYRDNPTLNKN